MANGDHLSVGAEIWSGLLTFWGGFLLLLARMLFNKLDSKVDRDEMHRALDAMARTLTENDTRTEGRHKQNLERLDHIYEILINKTQRNR